MQTGNIVFYVIHEKPYKAIVCFAEKSVESADAELRDPKPLARTVVSSSRFGPLPTATFFPPSVAGKLVGSDLKIRSDKVQG